MFKSQIWEFRSQSHLFDFFKHIYTISHLLHLFYLRLFFLVTRYKPRNKQEYNVGEE